MGTVDLAWHVVQAAMPGMGDIHWKEARACRPGGAPQQPVGQRHCNLPGPGRHPPPAGAFSVPAPVQKKCCMRSHHGMHFSKAPHALLCQSLGCAAWSAERVMLACSGGGGHPAGRAVDAHGGALPGVRPAGAVRRRAAGGRLPHHPHQVLFFFSLFPFFSFACRVSRVSWQRAASSTLQQAASCIPMPSAGGT